MDPFLVGTAALYATRHAAEEVYRELGTGHTENVYESALEVELALQGHGSMRRQVPSPIIYKSHLVGTGYIDILVDNILIVEVKTIAKLTAKEETQVRKYLVGTGLETGLLINFGPDLEILEVSLNQAKEPNLEQTLSTEGGNAHGSLLSQPER